MLASLDLSDPRLRRYAPVAALVVAAVLALLVPSKTNVLRSGTIEPTASAPTTTVTTMGGAVPSTTAAVTSPLPAAPTFSATATRPVSSPTTTAVAAATPVTTTAPSATPTGPLYVVKHTWAQSSTRRGTPIESAPEGTMPVAAFSGSNDRASYVKLGGGDAVLTLAVYDGDDADDSFADTAAIVACPIISADWSAQDGQSFASAPVYDEAGCVEGTRAEDGASWSWDLSAFADRGTSAGFALVPQPGGIGTWHVTFVSHA